VEKGRGGGGFDFSSSLLGTQWDEGEERLIRGKNFFLGARRFLDASRREARKEKGKRLGTQEGPF